MVSSPCDLVAERERKGIRGNKQRKGIPLEVKARESSFGDPSEFLRQKYSIINEQLMKSYSKTQLAEAAGVSVATFRRWLKTDEAYFHSQGIQTSAKLLPPHVVRYLCEKYCIDL